jgi:hypothetical protein
MTAKSNGLFPQSAERERVDESMRRFHERERREERFRMRLQRFVWWLLLLATGFLAIYFALGGM